MNPTPGGLRDPLQDSPGASPSTKRVGHAVLMGTEDEAYEWAERCMRGRPPCLRKYCGRVFGLAYSDEHRPLSLRSESSLAQYESTTIARPRDRSARRMAYAARLWLVDAALFRLDHYHWESRRRRLKKYDLRRRAKQSESRR